MTRFEVFAEDEAGEIGRGVHDRALVEHRRLREGAQRRRRERKVEG
jgi:predicted thioesterase